MSGLRFIGVLSSKQATIVEGILLDTLCVQSEKLMSFKPGERDLVMLQHKFVVEWTKETSTSTLELFEDPKLSVGVTCGIAAQLLLDRDPALSKPGVLRPYTTDICDLIWGLLEKEGVTMVEKTLSN